MFAETPVADPAVSSTNTFEKAPQKSRAHLIKPGQVLNPKGRPKGSRSKLSEDFVSVLYEDFTVHGKAAVIAVRERDPSTYVKVIAGLLPKEVTMARPLEGMTDDELIEAIAVLQAQIKGAVLEGEAVDVTPAAATE